MINHRLFNQEDVLRLQRVGINLKNNTRSGVFILYDNKTTTIPPDIKGIEIMPLQEALSLYPGIKKKYYFKAIDKNLDAYTQQVSSDKTTGYFIRVRKNVRPQKPLYTAFFMHTPNSIMYVHNIVVIEEGASLHLITGCTSGLYNREGMHIAISEHYIGKNASFTNTMIHNWGNNIIVRPRSSTIVSENATFTSNYYSVNPSKSIEAIPHTILKGKNSSAKYLTILACKVDTFCDIGGSVVMAGENSSAELVARAINYGGIVKQTGLLTGAAKGTRGHVDCSGMMINRKGSIEAVPGLKSMHPDARMSHEAAIGKIDPGTVNYLQSKGLEETQAISLIIRGFFNLTIDIEGFDMDFAKVIQQIALLSGHGE
jgi:uncharacterized protein